MAEAGCREVVGVFQDEISLRSAADALLIADFDRSSLSLLANHRRVVAKLGHDCESVTELEDDPGVPTRHYVGTDSRIEGEAALVGIPIYFSAILAIGIVVAAGGTAMDAMIAAAVVAAVVGAAAYALVRYLEGRHRRYLTEQVRRGGIPLWVRCEDARHEQRAIEILRMHGAAHVHSHEMAQVAYDVKGGESYQLSFMRALGL
jgi:hypothetical protein